MKPFRNRWIKRVLSASLAMGMLWGGMAVQAAQPPIQPSTARSWVISPKDSWQKVWVKVISPDGRPVTGLQVELGGQTVKTDQSGAALLTIRAGLHPITLTNLESGKTLTKTVKVEKRGEEQQLPALVWQYETPMDTVAKSNAGLSVQFVDPQMQPVSGVEVRFHFAADLRARYKTGKVNPDIGGFSLDRAIYRDFDTQLLDQGIPGQYQLWEGTQQGISDHAGRAGLVNCPKTEYYIVAHYWDSQGQEHGQRFYADLRGAQGRVDKVFCLDGASRATVTDNATQETVWQSTDSQSPRRVTMAYHRAKEIPWDGGDTAPQYSVAIHWENGYRDYSLWLDGNAQSQAVLMDQDTGRALELTPTDKSDLCKLLGIAQYAPPSEE